MREKKRNTFLLFVSIFHKIKQKSSNNNINDTQIFHSDEVALFLGSENKNGIFFCIGGVDASIKFSSYNFLSCANFYVISEVLVFRCMLFVDTMD